jgi:hypothetical protein
MRWLFFIGSTNTGEIFDDRVVAEGPGDPAFSRDAIEAELRRRGGDWGADYLGRSENAPPPAPSPG